PFGGESDCEAVEVFGRKGHVDFRRGCTAIWRRWDDDLEKDELGAVAGREARGPVDGCVGALGAVSRCEYAARGCNCAWRRGHGRILGQRRARENLRLKCNNLSAAITPLACEKAANEG